jgi:actin-related protein
MFIPNKSSNSGIPVILEFGSLNTRAGFAGKDRPDAVVPSVLHDAIKYIASDKTNNIKYEMEYYMNRPRENCDP